jgi:predicted nucleic acid-binding protein
MLYFDTSFLAPLILQEDTSEKVESFVAKLPAGELYVSHWTRTEFASLLAREVRIQALAAADALAALDAFDDLVAASFQVLVPRAVDFDHATAFIKNLATKLRAGDALHLAIASNHGAKVLYTLDDGLLAAARLLKIRASRGIKT